MANALVDLHGQHAHQSLLSSAVQRGALDDFGSDRAWSGHRCPPSHPRRPPGPRPASAATPGPGPASSTCCAFQVGELDAARLDDPDEDDALAAEERAAGRRHRPPRRGRRRGRGPERRRRGAPTAGAGVAGLAGRPPLAAAPRPAPRRRPPSWPTPPASSGAVAESLEDDPERLAEVRARRQLLRELRRKYGDTLADVIAFAGDAQARLEELESYEERAARPRAGRRAEAEADLAGGSGDRRRPPASGRPPVGRRGRAASSAPWPCPGPASR